MFRPRPLRAAALAFAGLCAACGASTGETLGDLADSALRGAVRARCVYDDRCVSDATVERLDAHRSRAVSRTSPRGSRAAGRRS